MPLAVQARDESCRVSAPPEGGGEPAGPMCVRAAPRDIPGAGCAGGGAPRRPRLPLTESISSPPPGTGPPTRPARRLRRQAASRNQSAESSSFTIAWRADLPSGWAGSTAWLAVAAPAISAAALPPAEPAILLLPLRRLRPESASCPLQPESVSCSPHRTPKGTLRPSPAMTGAPLVSLTDRPGSRPGRSVPATLQSALRRNGPESGRGSLQPAHTGAAGRVRTDLRRAAGRSPECARP